MRGRWLFSNPVTHLEYDMHRLLGDIIFIAILALFKPKFLNHAHCQLVRTAICTSIV